MQQGQKMRRLQSEEVVAKKKKVTAAKAAWG